MIGATVCILDSGIRFAPMQKNNSKEEKIMIQKTCVSLLTTFLLAAISLAQAQPAKKVFRIGFLSRNRPSPMPSMINVKTAKEIGVTIPPNVLARADRVIK